MATNPSSMLGLVSAKGRAAYLTDSEQEIALTVNGAQLVAQVVPDYADLVSRGGSYITISGTAVAPVAAVPTTAAQFTLWNGEQAGGKSYVIDYVGSICTTSAAAVITLSLLAHNGINQTSVKPTVTNATTFYGLNGSAYRGTGYGGGNGTITQSSVWHPVPVATPSLISSASTATIGMAVGGDVRGRYVVTPGSTFSLATLCSAAGSATNLIYCIWHEVQIVNF